MAGGQLFDQMPYGQSVDEAEIIDTLTLFDDWEDRYRYIIDLGKVLPEVPAQLRTEDRLVRGCQSQVWLVAEEDRAEDERLRFLADSDAFIVRGLIAVVFAALNCKSAEQILTYDMESYLDTLALLRHLSRARGNGLRSMVETIRQMAAKRLAKDNA